jgi:hypothetical protein
MVKAEKDLSHSPGHTVEEAKKALSPPSPIIGIQTRTLALNRQRGGWGGGRGRGVGEGGEMTQTLYAHMNKINKNK